MVRLEHAEISPIESSDACDVQAFRDCHDEAIDKIKLSVRIPLADIVNPRQVFLNNWLKFDVVMIKEVKEVHAIGIAQVAPQQVADFRQHNIWNEQDFGATLSEIKGALMSKLATIIKSNQETAVDNKGQRSMRLFK